MFSRFLAFFQITTINRLCFTQLLSDLVLAQFDFLLVMVLENRGLKFREDGNEISIVSSSEIDPCPMTAKRGLKCNRGVVRVLGAPAFSLTICPLANGFVDPVLWINVSSLICFLTRFVFILFFFSAIRRTITVKNKRTVIFPGWNISRLSFRFLTQLFDSEILIHFAILTIWIWHELYCGYFIPELYVDPVCKAVIRSQEYAIQLIYSIIFSLFLWYINVIWTRALECEYINPEVFVDPICTAVSDRQAAISERVMDQRSLFDKRIGTTKVITN